MFKRWLLIFSSIIIVMFFLAGCKSDSDGKFDILVKNGKIIDGTGSPWFYGDIGITGDTIVAIGDLSGKTASKTIDAKGLAVSP